MTDAVVVDGIVEPDEWGASVGGGVEEVDVAGIYHVCYTIACPHYLDSFAQTCAQTA